jgi:hypothetical protein
LTVSVVEGGVGGVAAVLSVSGDDAKAGVYDGNMHAISRTVTFFCAVSGRKENAGHPTTLKLLTNYLIRARVQALLVYFIRSIGLKIKAMLASGGAKTAKVAPASGDAAPPPAKKEKSDEQKILCVREAEKE